MIKLTITQIGIPKDIQTSKGPAQKNYLKAQEYNDKFLNFWVNGTTKTWAVGQVVEVEAVEEREYTAKDGSLKTSYDIKLPKFSGVGNVGPALERIENILAKLSLGMAQVLQYIEETRPKTKAKVMGTDMDYPEPEFDEGPAF